MNRYGLLLMGTMLIFAVSAQAQQTTTSARAPAKGESGQEDAGLPTVETQLKGLTEKLNLSGDQQNKIRPILKELHGVTEKLAEDNSLSHEERLAKVRPQRHKADEQIREVLSDYQKKKLDAYLRGPHPEMHGNLTGAMTPPPPQM
jgi:hypothetical protein